MWRSAIAMVAVGVLVLAAPAGAAMPLPGARYAGHTFAVGNHTKIRVNLIVDDDGGEFAAPSYFYAEPDCGTTIAIETLGLDAYSREPPTRIRADGSFSLNDRDSGQVRGRFVDHGRILTGSVQLHFPDPDVHCPSVRGRFRVEIVSFPARRPRHGLLVCDRVTVDYSERLDSDEAYRVFDHGRGCTKARADARRLDASATCRGRFAAGQTCTLADATCQAIAGGRYSALATTRCWTTARPGQDAEFTHYLPCPPPKDPTDADSTIYAWAINVDCGTVTTFPLASLIGDVDQETGPCGDIFDVDFDRSRTCAPFASYACTVRAIEFGPDVGLHARCRQQQNPLAAVEFDEDYG